MNKLLIISLIFLLILTTAFIKNSTKKIDDEIFTLKENLRSFNKELDKVKLEFNYLSSAEKLLEFQNLYFDEELSQKKINEIKIIFKSYDEFQIKKLNIIKND